MSDHEIVVDGVAKRLDLMKALNGTSQYVTSEIIPQYQNPMIFSQNSWVGGQGKYAFTEADCYAEGSNIDTTHDSKFFLGVAVVEVKEDDASDLDSPALGFCYFPTGTKWLCWTTGKIYLFDEVNNWWEDATTTVAGVTDMKVFDGVVYAALGSSTKYYYSIDGDTWTQTDLTDGYAEKFMVAPNAAGTADILWKYKLPNEVSSTTDGTVSGGTGVQWSSPAYIGDTTNNITNLFLSNSNFMVGRTDNLYNYDSTGGTHQLIPELAQNRSDLNFKYVANWQSSVYFSQEAGLGEITAYSTLDAVPLNEETINTYGSVCGLASDKDWLYIARKYESSKFPYTFPVTFSVATDVATVIYKGRESRRNGTLRWEWCPWINIGTVDCTCMAICQHSATDRRLWFSYGANTGYVKLLENPVSGDTSNDTLFSTSGYLRTSCFYGTNPYWDKLALSIVLETDNCSATRTVTVKYRADTDLTWTTMTGAITTNGVYITAFNNALTGKKFQVELDLATDDDSETPIVKMFSIIGAEKPPSTRVYECVYTLGDEPTRRTKTIRDFLRTARASKAPIKLVDRRYGDTQTSGYVWVTCQPGYPQEVEIVQEKDRAPEVGMKMRWQELN